MEPDLAKCFLGGPQHFFVISFSSHMCFLMDIFSETTCVMELLQCNMIGIFIMT